MLRMFLVALTGLAAAISCQQEQNKPTNPETIRAKAIMDSVRALSDEDQREYWRSRARESSEQSKGQLNERRSRAAEEAIEDQFSAWDGSHRELVANVERRLNDPGSFEHLETKTMRGSNWPRTYIVRMEYTAKNTFGGRVRNYILAEISVQNGNIVQVIDEGKP